MPVDTFTDREPTNRGTEGRSQQLSQQLSQQEMERTPYSSESFRVRCPNCRKLYLVQFNDIQEAKPRFECSQCHERFWLSLPDMDLSSELTGLPLQVKEAPAQPKMRKNPLHAPAVKKEIEPCPKCFKPNEIQAKECGHCGVMLTKARANQGLTFEDTIPPRSVTLEGAWKKVVDDYGDEKAHADFLRLSQSEHNLPYAAAQYGQMQKLMPTDEITKQRIKEIQALGATLMPPREERPPGYMYPRLWQIPLLGAAILIIVGMVLPMFRNIVGLGAAFLFLGIAMQIQLRRKG